MIEQERHKLRIREDRFRAVAEASSDILWITTPDGKMSEESSSWQAFTGQSVSNTNALLWLDAIHPEDQEQVEVVRLQALASGQVSTTECRIQRADGAYRLMRIRGIPVRDTQGNYKEWIGTGIDITEQKQIEQELQHQEQVVQIQTDLIELAHDAIIIRDLNSHIVSWNQGAATLYGWAEEEAAGQITHSLLQTQFPDSREAVDRALVESGYWEGRLIHITRQGKQVIVESRQVLARDTDGIPTAILEINRDITEHEQLLRERAEAEAAELALRETARQVDTFLGIASHELKGPLTTIKATAQLAKRQLHYLKQAITDETARTMITTIWDLLDRAERQTNVQNRLVNDLVDASRIHSDRLELQIIHCNLVEIIRDIVDDQRTLTPTRDIQWETSLLEAEVLADPGRVGQIVNNYLSNALKYSEANKPVNIRIRREKAMVRVEVIDQGPGLSKDQQQRIWERFYRADGIEVKSGSSVGLGLGLYICRSLIERQGGQFGVESIVDQGSTFWFTLPLVNP